MGLEPTALYQCITHALMQAGVEDHGEMRLDASICGGLIRLKVLDSSGAVAMSVIGSSYEELGRKFVLACLNKVSAERLRELHQTPLREAVPVMKIVK